MPTKIFRLEGKRVLVTGASSGIGRATAQVCAQLGASIVCCGRNAAALHETIASLGAGNHTLSVFDVDDSEALAAQIATVARDGGALAGLVHAAGIQRAMPLRVAKPENFLGQFRTNSLSAAMLLSAVAKRGVADSQGCSVVLVGSVMSVLGAPGLAGYCASKAALTGLVQAAALELAQAGVRVNAVLPGMVDTPMSQEYRSALGADQLKAIEAMHPLGLGQAVDVAHSIAFLISGAARWITGTCLTVDGGYSAQ